LCATLLALYAPESRAQPATPPLAPPVDAADGRMREARALYERGVRHFHLAEYDAAIDAFKSAYRTAEAPGFLYNIALAYRMKGDCAQALHFYRMYLRLQPAAPNRREVETRIEEQRRCALAATPASRPGPAPASQPGAAASAPTPPRPAPAVAPVATRPEPRPAPAPRTKLKLVLGLTTAVVGVVFVAAAAYQGVKARNASDTINDLFQRGGQWDAHYRSVEADGRRASTQALAFSIVGGVAILGGATLAYLGWRERARPAVVLTPGGAALTLSCAY
jgi:tetratricopeptide (TPR) repeat protein